MTLKLDPATQNHLDNGVDALADEFSGIFSRETIQAYVDESLEQLETARLQEFLPLLVNRFARERLRAVAQAEGMLTKELPEVLFVCVHMPGAARWPRACSKSGRTRPRRCRGGRGGGKRARTASAFTREEG
jgi:arsenate reductase